MKVKEILKRLKNTGTIVAITSAAIMIIANLGFSVDGDKVMYIVNALCSVGVALGVLNNPTSPGIDGIGKKDKEELK
ncbi:phage holin [Eubacterium multiforme]|uniref:Membrane protein n=1 Tax=Eubacterium multiforme TaxID=83339 RepID=A0ABT9UW51_9FIRM|nr:phage holin [Eubacterium multiforme]MDQ0150555.1 putative membrane protein [Eubacterium multiforme]